MRTGPSTVDTQQAARWLAARGIPLISATANALREDGVMRITPDNDQFAEALADELVSRSLVPTRLISDGPSDPYVGALSDSLARRWPGHLERNVVDSTLGFQRAVQQLCQDDSVVFYSGRSAGLRNVVNSIAIVCPNQPITVVTETIGIDEAAREVHRTKLTLVYASPVDPAGWASGSVYAPPGFARFEASYSAQFADRLDDGYALLHHDAALAAFTAVNYTVAIATPAVVREALQRFEIQGATGAISFGQAGSPVGKPIAVLDFPRRPSDRAPYVTR
ncbi:hypothetical protein GCM10022267_57450 [Lentzea roselyniae]|uniref:Substrate-binding protein n=1 Tax=Lentzea roselyniae TaxID=531940 RepID=A0ABP7BKZ3_9PSEU